MLKRIIEFLRRSPIIANIIYICAACLVISFIGLLFLDSWTNHGEESVVPQVKGLSYPDAEKRLRGENYVVEIIDSVYDASHTPGMVVEQSPRAGAKVKPGREVYLTIVAFSPKMVTVPYYLNASLRQATAMFEGLGLKNIEVREVVSEYKDLVLGAKFNGVPLKPGVRIPVTATITLEVGSGFNQATDSIDEAELLLDIE